MSYKVDLENITIYKNDATNFGTQLLRLVTDNGVAVKTKGGATKLKIFTKDFRDVFIRYAKHKRGKIFPMSYNYYYTLLKRLGKEVGQPKLAPHMLRHARAIDLLRKGMQLSDVQQFLGHANINTTARYLLITGGDLVTVVFMKQ